jgi:fluoroquinolone resistance protein
VLRGQWRGQWLDGADLENVILFGADLTNCSFARCNLKNANLAYARIEGCSFREADLEGADLLYTDIKRARFDGAMIGPTNSIPGVYAGARREW